MSIPSFVCSGVGDFDDYMKHKKNCLMVDREDFVEKGGKLLFDLFSNKDWKENLCNLGENAKNDILNLFAIEPVAKKYLNLIESINEG